MSAGEIASTSHITIARLFRVWLIDQATIDIMRKIRPQVITALNGYEPDLRAALAEDHVDSASVFTEEQCQREAEVMGRFWRAILVGELDEAKIKHAADLGRQQFKRGMSGGQLLRASQSVLNRLLDALMSLAIPDRARAIDAVTRLVLLADDIALSAYYEGVTGKVSELEVKRHTEELRRQMRVLEELAHVDGLTKLFNRRHFDQALEAELARSRRQKTPMGLLLADIDHFKKVNDTYGHNLGDAMLCHIAKVLHGTARRSDVLSRYGGEEFALILPTTTKERALIAAERLRRAVERTPLTLDGGPTVTATLSIGVAVAAGTETPSELVHMADLALYRAKDAGRNRIAN